MNRPRLGILLKSGGPRSGPGRYVRALADAAARDGFEVVEFRQSHGEPPTGPSRLVTLERSAPACREEMRPSPTWVRRWARGGPPAAGRPPTRPARAGHAGKAGPGVPGRGPPQADLGAPMGQGGHAVRGP